MKRKASKDKELKDLSKKSENIYLYSSRTEEEQFRGILQIF